MLREMGRFPCEVVACRRDYSTAERLQKHSKYHEAACVACKLSDSWACSGGTSGCPVMIDNTIKHRL